jgi:hypothetical protein
MFYNASKRLQEALTWRVGTRRFHSSTSFFLSQKRIWNLIILTVRAVACGNYWLVPVVARAIPTLATELLYLVLQQARSHNRCFYVVVSWVYGVFLGNLRVREVVDNLRMGIAEAIDDPVSWV